PYPRETATRRLREARNTRSKTIVDTAPLEGVRARIAEYPLTSVLFGGRGGDRYAGAGNGRCKRKNPAPPGGGIVAAARYGDLRQCIRQPGFPWTVQASACAIQKT